MRKLIGVLGALLALALVAGVAAVLWVRTSLPDREGTLALPGLTAPVEVLWDERAVPHIWAASIEDAAFAQGFLHARDRLWKMELVRHAVQGRLSEMMGDATVETDRFMRRIGLWDAARAGLELLDPRERALLQAYADGVNAALDTRSGALPPELLALRHEPEPWEPVHTLAVAKMMSFTLAAYGESVAVARALQRIEPERARFLFPEFPDWGTTIMDPDPAAGDAVPDSGSGGSARSPVFRDRAALADPAPGLRSPVPAAPPALAAALIDGFSVAAASNSWVVDGRWTRSGTPILANDTHLELQAPSLWYLVGLHAPAPNDTAAALDVVGVGIPGAPLAIIGRNRAVAWGMTNAYVDDVDLFVERVDPVDPGRYRVPGGSEPFRVRTDTIRVDGREDPVLLEVRATRHGPVLPLAGGDASSGGDSLVVAVQWTALRPSTVFRGIMGLNLARSWDEFLRAADAMDDPHQNLVYADTAGHIGYVMGGTVPVRGDRRPAPVAPVPGWTGEWDWGADLPFREHPRVLDPPAGYVVTANNRQTRDPVGDIIGQTWNPPFRAMRIRDLITGGAGRYTAGDIHAMQMDVVDLYARRYLDRAVDAASAAGLAQAASLLEAWDGTAGAASRAATLFYLWNELVRDAAARDLYGGEPAYFPMTSAGAVLEARALPWADHPGRRYREIADAAIRDAVSLADRPWGQANRVVHRHAMGRVALLDRLLGLDLGPTPHHGSSSTVNVAHWAYQSPAESFPFTTTAGPSERQVVEMGNLGATGGFVIGTGQGGIPFDRHYDDQLPLWREGGLIPMPLERGAVERRATHRMTLNPRSGNDGS